ncbi:MAG: hypothetical protein ACYCU3_20895, partial [Streptosporangiaceae bacterium]
GGVPGGGVPGGGVPGGGVPGGGVPGDALVRGRQPTSGPVAAFDSDGTLIALLDTAGLEIRPVAVFVP